MCWHSTVLLASRAWLQFVSEHHHLPGSSRLSHLEGNKPHPAARTQGIIYSVVVTKLSQAVVSSQQRVFSAVESQGQTRTWKWQIK